MDENVNKKIHMKKLRHDKKVEILEDKISELQNKNKALE